MVSTNSAKIIISLSAIGMVLTLLMADFKYASKYGFWASLPHTQTVLFEGIEYEEPEANKENETNQCNDESAYLCYLKTKGGTHSVNPTRKSYKYKIEYGTQDGLVILSLLMAFGFFALFKKRDN